MMCSFQSNIIPVITVILNEECFVVGRYDHVRFINEFINIEFNFHLDFIRKLLAQVRHTLKEYVALILCRI